MARLDAEPEFPCRRFFVSGFWGPRHRARPSTEPSQAFTTRTGTQIEKIDNTNYGWFKASMRNLDQNSLPHDHHEVVAMMAPRAVVALGNPPYERKTWLRV